MKRAASVLFAVVLSGCRPGVPIGALVLTQIPPGGQRTTNPRTESLLYPAGSRIVLARPPFDPTTVRLLSPGFFAAGSPLLTPDGRDVYFVGKTAPASAWQIYRVPTVGGRPLAVTSVAGGAMDPALLPDGSLVFSSPVPEGNSPWSGAHPAALFVQKPASGRPERLTFGPNAAVDPTVLADGRILFVAVLPAAPGVAPARSALFTVNSDGTEFTPYACEHDGRGVVRRPRQLAGGRIGFLAAAAGAPGQVGRAEAVRSANPFSSRGALLPNLAARCRSIDPDTNGDLLIACERGASATASSRGSFGIYEVKPGARGVGTPLFDDPRYDDVEAVRVARRPPAMGHLSTVKPGSATGLILCLDANRTTLHSVAGGPMPAVARVRVLTQNVGGKVEELGQVPVASDGSFFAEVPADVPLGFEALDARGRVLRRLPPTIWVRPGENRACIGCHEQHNTAPPNRRPLAVKAPPVRVGVMLTTLARKERRP
jgi:Hydrazine synthase alpha subunit middle domain